MSFEIPGFQPGPFSAEVDMTGKQYTCVKLGAAELDIAPCTVAAEDVFAVIQDEPVAGENAHLIMTGITRIKAGAACAVGDFWSTDATGRAVPNVLGTPGQYVNGKVLTPAAAAGEIISVTIGMQNHIV